MWSWLSWIVPRFAAFLRLDELLSFSLEAAVVSSSNAPAGVYQKEDVVRRSYEWLIHVGPFGAPIETKLVYNYSLSRICGGYISS